MTEGEGEADETMLPDNQGERTQNKTATLRKVIHRFNAVFIKILITAFLE